MDKSKLSEPDICEKFISPALVQAGWDVIEQILREVPLRPGRMVVRGTRASRDKAEHRRLQAEAQCIRDQLKALLGAALGGKA